MYYYGYSGGYGYNNPCYSGSTGGYAYPVNTGYGYGAGTGYGAAIILVLFILLVIIFGVGFINNGYSNNCNSCNN